MCKKRWRSAASLPLEDIVDIHSGAVKSSVGNAAQSLGRGHGIQQVTIIVSGNAGIGIRFCAARHIIFMTNCCIIFCMMRQEAVCCFARSATWCWKSSTRLCRQIRKWRYNGPWETFKKGQRGNFLRMKMTLHWLSSKFWFHRQAALISSSWMILKSNIVCLNTHRKGGFFLMNDDQKAAIAKMRNKGCGYGRIAAVLGLNLSTVKSHCRRQKIRKDETVENTLVDFCRNCGVPVRQTPGRKKKLFCSNSCRMQWWNAQPDQMRRKTWQMLICQNCGKEFKVYGRDVRKYCCHSCYVEARFGKCRKCV